MDNISFIDNYFELLKYTIDKLSREEILNFSEIIKSANENNKHVFVFGNGGSASTASHFVCDINKGASYLKDKRHKVICLNDSISTIMAYSNDVSYEDIFVEQLKNFLEEGDVIVGISGSGNSKNVIKAIEYGNANKAITVGITGYTGGTLKQVAQKTVNANVNDMQVSEDIHMILVHITMRLLNITKEGNSKDEHC